MSGINVGRVVIGGIVAGLVGNALDFVTNSYLMAEEMSQMAQRLNLSDASVNGTATIVTWVVVNFIWGLSLVFVYAGIRPRFGPGPKTAMISGLALWLPVCAIFAGLTAIGIYTQAAFMKSAVLSLATTLAASLAGAAVYKE